ncbi:MAG TPA: radical SAM protein [Chitinivibrionales bacterium]|nr:radical SAM protein [Chitinivibrionales bacterium]
MKIILFNPRGFVLDPKFRRLHQLACVMPPIGLASIAAVLRNAGHQVLLLDAALENEISNGQWTQRILSQHPDIVGFSAVTSAFLDAYDVAQRIKRQDDKITTVFGGVHVSWGRERILGQFPEIDFVIAGEGEYAMLKLANGAPHTQIEGLHFRNGTSMEHGPDPAQCAMDDLPYPAYDLLLGFPKRYLMPLFSYPRHPGANVISSRGCVYQCSYCDRSVFGKGFRFNSPEYTAGLVSCLARDFGVRHVNFYDDLFTLNRERVAGLCELLVKSKPRVSFNCIVRLGHVDSELIRLLKSAGCFMVNVGIESGDQDILDKHKSGLALEIIRRDIEKLAAGGLYVKGLFMMGFPGEDEASIAKTRDFAVSLPLKDANMTAFTPFPGAPITAGIRSLGQFDDDWQKMDCEHFVFVPKEISSRETLERRYREFIKGFYQRKYMRKMYYRMLFECPHSYLRLARHGAAFLSYAFSMNRRRSS